MLSGMWTTYKQKNSYNESVTLVGTRPITVVFVVLCCIVVTIVAVLVVVFIVAVVFSVVVVGRGVVVITGFETL